LLPPHPGQTITLDEIKNLFKEKGVAIYKIDKEFASLFRQYYDEAYQVEMGLSNIPGFKVTPIQEHISAEMTLYPYHRVEGDIKSARVIAVANCVCRTKARLLGHGCDKPLETCLSFGAAAERVTAVLSRNNKPSPWRRRPSLLRRFQKRAGRRGRKPCRSRPACRGWRQ